MQGGWWQRWSGVAFALPGVVMLSGRKGKVPRWRQVTPRTRLFSGSSVNRCHHPLTCRTVFGYPSYTSGNIDYSKALICSNFSRDVVMYSNSIPQQMGCRHPSILSKPTTPASLYSSETWDAGKAPPCPVC